MADIIEIIEAPSMPVIIVQPPTPIELTVSSGITDGTVEAATSLATPNTLVKRSATGTAVMSRIYATQAPGANDELTRKDYVDSQAALRSRRYDFNPPALGWMRLATIDGQGTSGGSSLEFLLTHLGDYGSTNRGTVLVQFAQRGDNTTKVKIFGWGYDASSNKPTFYTKQISTWRFELWIRVSQFTQTHSLTLLSVAAVGATGINVDSGTTTDPGGLSAAIPVSDWDTEFTPLTAISAIPPRIGKIAVVGAVAYIAVGTASTADWKQITN